MQLKCIGGECDGQLIEIEQPKIGLSVGVIKPYDFKVTNFPQEISESETNACTYRICAIHGTGYGQQRMKHLYLCPVDWHEWEALMHQFGK